MSTFVADLAFSKTHDAVMQSICRAYFADAFSSYVNNDDVALDKLGVDAFVSLLNGRKYAIDNKICRYRNDNFPLEVLSNDRTLAPGWALNLTLKTDYVVYYKLMMQYGMVLPKTALHTFTKNVIDAVPEMRADNGTYTSVFILASKTQLLNHFGQMSYVPTGETK